MFYGLGSVEGWEVESVHLVMMKLWKMRCANEEVRWRGVGGYRGVLFEREGGFRGDGEEAGECSQHAPDARVLRMQFVVSQREIEREMTPPIDRM